MKGKVPSFTPTVVSLVIVLACMKIKIHLQLMLTEKKCSFGVREILSQTWRILFNFMQMLVLSFSKSLSLRD